MAEECNISTGSLYDILTTKSEIRQVVSKFVPQLLTQDWRDSCIAICEELLDRATNDENFPKIIITGDETWVYGNDVETKMESSQWVGKNSQRPKMAQRVRSNVKVMLTVLFFDIESVVHHELLHQGQTVNRWY
jgi:hypothetical protein